MIKTKESVITPNFQVLFTNDLLERFKELPIEKIKIEHFPTIIRQDFRHQDLVMFVNNSCQTKILKNIYGIRGMVVDNER